MSRRGWTVHTARAEERLGDPDREHLSFARENDWILVTFDDDFLSLVEGSCLDHAGIIYVHISKVESQVIAESTTANPPDGDNPRGYGFQDMSAEAACLTENVARGIRLWPP